MEFFKRIAKGPYVVSAFYTVGTFTGPGNRQQDPKIRAHLVDFSGPEPVSEVFDFIMTKEINSDIELEQWIDDTLLCDVDSKSRI